MAGESVKLFIGYAMINARYRLVCILIGRLRLSPSKAIEAYMKLVVVMPNEQAKDEDERKKNTEESRAAFIEVLENAGFDQHTAMLDEEMKF
jgi:hypothetical protein